MCIILICVDLIAMNVIYFADNNIEHTEMRYIVSILQVNTYNNNF